MYFFTIQYFSRAHLYIFVKILQQTFTTNSQKTFLARGLFAFILRELYCILSRTQKDSPTRRGRKTNPRVSMNEERLSNDDDFRWRRSLRGCKTHLPLPPVPSRQTVRWEGWRESSLPPGSHAECADSSLLVPSPPPPPRCSILGARLLPWKRTLLRGYSARINHSPPLSLSLPLGSPPLPPPVRPSSAVKIYSGVVPRCAPVILKQLVARFIRKFQSSHDFIFNNENTQEDQIKLKFREESLNLIQIKYYLNKLITLNIQ